jgi:hypothetical protein
VDGLDIDNINTKPVVLYINGAYCGLYYLDEEQNEDYIQSHYGLDENNIDIINQGQSAIAGDMQEYQDVCTMARTWDLSDDEVFAEFSKLVDVGACTDYLVTQIYFGNSDIVNQRFWRARDYSVKWRLLLFDLDYSLCFSDEYVNVFSRYFTEHAFIGGTDINGERTREMYIFCGLKKNEGWRDKFVERFVQLAVTQFSPDRILSIFDDMVAELEPEMEQHIKRWHTPGSMSIWRREVGSLRDALEKRQGIVLLQLQRYFDVPEETMQTYIEKYSPKR